MSAYDTFIVYCLGMVCAVARMQLCCSDVHSSSGKDDLSRYYLLVTHRSHLRILQFKRRSWSFEYMHRLLFAGRSGFIQSRVLPLQSKVPSCTSSGGCIVRRASMSLYPTLDIKGQTVLITGEQTTVSAQSRSSPSYHLQRVPAPCCMRK